MKQIVSETELYSSDNEGICIACGARQGGVEPDAHEYQCEACGEMKVYGLEEAVISGKVTLVDGEGE